MTTETTHIQVPQQGPSLREPVWSEFLSLSRLASTAACTSTNTKIRTFPDDSKIRRRKWIDTNSLHQSVRFSSGFAGGFFSTHHYCVPFVAPMHRRNFLKKVCLGMFTYV